MTSDPEWSPCDTGTLANICQDATRDPVAWTRRSAVAAMVATVAGGSWLAVQTRKHGRLACTRVAELAPLYLTGTLVPNLVKEIDDHRHHCQPCDTKLKQMETAHRKV
jgi:hypothetical protein